MLKGEISVMTIRYQLTKLKVLEEYNSLHSGVTWENIQAFSVLVGLNGVGKSHLLNWLYDRLINVVNERLMLQRFDKHENSLTFQRFDKHENSFTFQRDDVQLPRNCARLIQHDLKFRYFVNSQNGDIENIILYDKMPFNNNPLIEQIIFQIIENLTNKNLLWGIREFDNLWVDFKSQTLSEKDKDKLLETVKNILSRLTENTKKAIINKINSLENSISVNDKGFCSDKNQIGIIKKNILPYIENYLPLILNDSSGSSEKILLDNWFKAYSSRKKSAILRAFQMDDRKKLSIIEIEKIIESEIGTAPWDELNEKFSQYRKEYNFKHLVKIPDISEENINCQFEIIDQSGNHSDPIKFEELSSGEKMIIQIFLLMHNRDIFGYDYQFLLLDEPDAHFHPSLAKLFIETIQEQLVQKMNIQVIMTTHHPTTIALAPSDSVFEMHRSEDGKMHIDPVVNTAAAIETLTDNQLIVTPKDHRLVFVEDKDDADFYQKMFQKAVEMGLCEDRVYLFFTSAAISSTSKAKGNGGCTAVKEFVKRLRTNEQYKAKNDTQRLSVYKKRSVQGHFIFGLIDKDDKNISEDGVFTMHRREYENFAYDLFIISMCVYYYDLYQKKLDLAEENFNNVCENMIIFFDKFELFFLHWMLMSIQQDSLVNLSFKTVQEFKTEIEKISITELLEEIHKKLSIENKQTKNKAIESMRKLLEKCIDSILDYEAITYHISIFNHNIDRAVYYPKYCIVGNGKDLKEIVTNFSRKIELKLPGDIENSNLLVLPEDLLLSFKELQGIQVAEDLLSSSKESPKTEISSSLSGLGIFSHDARANDANNQSILNIIEDGNDLVKAKKFLSDRYKKMRLH